MLRLCILLGQFAVAIWISRYIESQLRSALTDIQSPDTRTIMESATSSSSIMEFFTSAGRDYRGRSLDDILRYSNPELESHHDYIQVLFPLHETSAFNDEAPILTPDDAVALQTSTDVRANVMLALRRMCIFYTTSSTARHCCGCQ